MVAITVILAAVIAAFVFGMSGNIAKTKTVAWTAQKIDAATITLTNNGGQDAQNLVTVKVTTDPAGGGTCVVSDGVNSVATYADPTCSVTINGAATYIPVGDTIKITAAATTTPFSVKTKVTVVGTFSDGSDYVLMDTTV